MTTKITTMDRAAVNRIVPEAEAALRLVAERFGLALKRESGRFDPTAGTFTARFTFVCETEDGVPADWTRYAPAFGLAADDFGRTFTTWGGKSFTICGIKPRAKKYPVLARGPRGGIYKFAAGQVSAALARTAGGAK